LYDRQVNYEMYMSAALSEARAAATRGEIADGAVAVLNEALVASAHCQVVATGDPTAHSVLMVIREAARRLGRTDLSGIVVFTALEPCAMCVGALLEADADGIVFALADARTGATAALAQGRLSVVSGIMQREAAELKATPASAFGGPAARA
jgi:tRNA(Arg) A34 adenosine deaminase TadA